MPLFWTFWQYFMKMARFLYSYNIFVKILKNEDTFSFSLIVSICDLIKSRQYGSQFVKKFCDVNVKFSPQMAFRD